MTSYGLNVLLDVGMKKSFLLAALFCGCFFSPLESYALPFRGTAKDFEYFVNQVWQKGRVGNTYMWVTMQSQDPNERRSYFGFYNCKYTENISPQRKEDFECLGYLDRITPIRSVRCLINISYLLGTASDSEAAKLTGDPNAGAGWYGSLWQHLYGTELSACRPI